MTLNREVRFKPTGSKALFTEKDMSCISPFATKGEKCCICLLSDLSASTTAMRAEPIDIHKLVGWILHKSLRWPHKRRANYINSKT
jgi:hypothetical protein